MQKKAISYIRYSSGVQALGDSLRRQTEDTEKWCAENDAELLDTYSDLGISAFRGKNVEVGALGSILAIAKGEVRGENLPEDVYLVCESLDRLGRDDIENQLAVFLLLLAAGVNIVTLLDKQIYYRSKHPLKKRGDTARDLIISITIMSRANDESETKSDRSTKNWIKKQKEAKETGKVLTKNCPSWVRVVGGKYEVIEERVKVIHQISEMFVKYDLGVTAIATKLNEMGIPRFASNVYKKKEGGLWTKCAVNTLVSSHALVGRYIPNSKKEIKGKPIEKFYPVVITEETFKKMALIQKGRSKGGNFSKRGKTVEKMNLLSGIGLCAECGSNLHHENKKAGYRYYGCAYCGKTRVKYSVFNDCLMSCLPQIDWDAVYSKDDEEKEAHERILLEAKLVDLKLENEGVLKFLKRRATDAIMERNADLEDEIAIVEELLEKFAMSQSKAEIDLQLDLNLIEQRVAFNLQLRRVFKSVRIRKYDKNSFAVLYELVKGGCYYSFAKRKTATGEFTFLHSFDFKMEVGAVDWSSLEKEQSLALEILQQDEKGANITEQQKLLAKLNEKEGKRLVEEFQNYEPQAAVPLLDVIDDSV